MPQNVLITGGAGFIGSHLVRRLIDAGNEVSVIDDFSVGSPASIPDASDVRVVEADVRDADSMSDAVSQIRPTAIVHLAAIHFIPRCNKHPGETFDVNVKGTLNLFEAARRCDLNRVVLASSAAVYPIQDAACEERQPTHPTDVYGASKVALEALGQRFAAETGVPVVAARLFNVYGPGETNPHVVPDILGQLDDGPIRLGRLTPRRDYVHVGDVATALQQFLDIPAGEWTPVNVGTGREWSVQDIVSTLERLLDRPLDVVSEESRRRRHDRAHLLASTDRIRAMIDWSPRALERGLSDLLAATAKL